MNSFIKTYLLGGIDPLLFLASVFFAAVGVLLILLIGTRLRDPNSIESPKEWSWKYLLSDNAKRIYANVIAILVTLRFMPEITGIELSTWKALCVGIGWDSILLLIKQKTSFLDPTRK